MRPETPPVSLLLVHGAGSGPDVYAEWPAVFPSLQVSAVDLQRGVDVSRASHAHYAARVVEAAAELGTPVSLCGWSMGGLAVLQAAAQLNPHSVVLIETSPPREVQGFNPDVVPEPGSFDPEEIYGPFPAGVAARRESLLARAERKRGISVPSLPCPSLVVFGREFAAERGAAVARLYCSDELSFPELDHWHLVRDRRVRGSIAAWLGVTNGGSA
jgi:pimeloyl-ACP methyl ester carboxylesterase